MSEMMTNSLDDNPAPMGEKPSFENLPNASDWEKRVSEARLQREKVLQKRATNSGGPAFKVSEHWQDVRAGDEVTAADLLARAMKINDHNKAGAVQQSTDHDHEGDAQSEVPRGAEITSTHAAPVGGTRKWLEASKWLQMTGRIKPVYLLACSVGFGFGFALGLGFLLSVWWSPLSSNASTADAMEVDIVEPELANGSQSAPVMLAAVMDTATPVDALAAQYVPDLRTPQTTYDAAPDVVLPKITQIAYVPADEGEPATVAHALPLVVPSKPDDADLALAVGQEKPSTQSVSYYLHAPESVSEQELQEYVAVLDTSGYPVAKIGRERFRVSATHLRFYSAKNAELAQSIASNLGVEAKDFSQESGNSGRIEIWLAGTSLAALKVQEEAANRSKIFLRPRLRVTRDQR